MFFSALLDWLGVWVFASSQGDFTTPVLLALRLSVFPILFQGFLKSLASSLPLSPAASAWGFVAVSEGE